MLTLEKFNEIRGSRFAATEANIALVDKLNALNATEDEIRALPYVKPFPRGFHELRQAASDISKARKAAGTIPAKIERKTAPAPAPIVKEPTPAPVKAAPAADNGAALIAAINAAIKAPALDRAEIEALVNAIVDRRVNDITPARIEVKTARGIHAVQGTRHEAFEEIVTYISNDQPVYIYGPAGTGKTHLAAQVAEALGLNFYYSGQLSQEYKFTGFTDANGRFQATPFYKAWTEGGLFFLDEMDRSFPEVVTDLNGALANGIFDFPAPIGTVKKHPDFRCLAAGNTLGAGATRIYTAANALDGSTRNRFLMVQMDYDSKIEDSIDKEAAEFVRALRKTASLAGMDVILSYRTIQSLARFGGIVGIKKAIKAAITAPLSPDDINILKRDSRITTLAASGNKYAAAFA